MQGTPGYAFTDGVVNDCSNTHLHTFYDSSTYINAALDDFKDSERPIWVSDRPPVKPKIGQTWWLNKVDLQGLSIILTSTAIGVMLAWNGSNWVPFASGVLMYNNSGSDVATGKVVIVSTGADQAFTVAAGNGIGVALGLEAGKIKAGKYGAIITRGFMYVDLVAGAVNGGSLTQSATPGKGTANTVVTQTKCFGVCVDASRNVCYLNGMMKA